MELACARLNQIVEISVLAFKVFMRALVVKDMMYMKQYLKLVKNEKLMGDQLILNGCKKAIWLVVWVVLPLAIQI